MYLRDCWYAAAWSDEVMSVPLERTLCGEKLVLFRRSDGHVAALSGVCPHRFASLARGKLLPSGNLQCPYHGLQFDSAGRCVHNPHGPVPSSVRLANYTSVERHGLVWLWWGESTNANTDLIPDFACMEDPKYRTIHGTIMTRGHYELVTDNLMDLSHVGFLHAGGLGSESIQNGKHQVFQTGTTIDSNRWCPDAPASPVWNALFNNYDRNVDHWLDMRWDAPASMLLDVGVAPAGSGRQGGITQWGAHILTPQDENTTIYFWASVRDFALQSDETDRQIRTAVEFAFGQEDKPMIEDVQQNMRDKTFDEMRPLLLPFDRGSVLTRRLLAELISGKKALQPTSHRAQTVAAIQASATGE
jgi:phenylpropionate dioxygenase-like ring-hydroxylating dioxygenase large terminal subunit